MDVTSTVETILANYLQAEATLGPMDPDNLIAMYPEYAAELTEFFELRQYVGRLVTSVPKGSAKPNPTFPYTFGDYQIVGHLGSGGMGIVLKAIHTSNGRLVALKVSKSGRFASVEDRRRFRTEAEAGMGLDHPGIIPIYAIGEADGQDFFTMQLLSGGTLPDRRSEFANPRVACQLIIELASAVEHAHHRGILHRDLKPSNVLFDDNGRPHVSDFGLARFESAGDLTRSGAAIGTPSYMAPEQRAGKSGTETTATDVHGLGAILYYVLTGLSPYPTDSQAVNTSILALPAVVPSDLAAICLKCLQSDQRLRYPRPQDLADDLTRFIAGRPILARRTGIPTKFLMAARRHPAMTLLAVVAATAVASAGYFAASEYFAVRQLNTKLSAALDRERIQLDRLAHSDFASRLRQAADLAEDDRPAEAYDLLLKLRPGNGEPDHRGFAWHYLRRQLFPRRAIRVPDGKIVSASMAPDGQTCVTAGTDGFVRVWDLVAESELAAWAPVGIRELKNIVYRPDGASLAITGELKRETQAILVTDLSGRQLAEATFPGEVNRPSWAANGRKLLFRGQAQSLVEWDISGGKQPVAVDTAGWRCSAVRIDSIQGRWATALTRRGQTIVKVGAAAEHFTAGRILLTHTSPIWTLNFNPDGSRLAIMSDDSAVWIMDVATGKELASRKVQNEIVQSNITWADGGNSLFLSTWSKQQGALLRVLDPVTCTPRNERVAEKYWCAMDRDQSGRICLFWTADELLHFRSQPFTASETLAAHTGEVWAVAFSPDGRILASGSDDSTIRLWDVESRTVRAVLAGHSAMVMQVAFTPDGQELVSSGWDGSIRRWEVATGRQLAEWVAHQKPVEGLALTRDGRFVISHGRDGRVCVWERHTHSMVKTLAGEKRHRQFVAISPDDRWVATNNEGRSVVRIWDTRDWSEVAALDSSEPALAAAFSPDSRELIVALRPNRVVVWNPGTGKTRLSFYTREATIRTLACAPDGMAILTTGYMPDIAIRAWNMENGQPILRLTGHHNTVNKIVFSHDGRTLASGSHDRSIRLWLTDTPQTIPSVPPGFAD